MALFLEFMGSGVCMIVLDHIVVKVLNSFVGRVQMKINAIHFSDSLFIFSSTY